MSSLVQNLFIFLGLVVVLALGYYLYTQNEMSSLSLNNDAISTQVAAESAMFLSRLNELKKIDLDDSLFSDPRFRSLIDNSAPVIEDPVGRPNPFVEVD